MLDQQSLVVFYDMTTVRIHGEGDVGDDVRAFGMNKEAGCFEWQSMLVVMQSTDGLPLMHTGALAPFQRCGRCARCGTWCLRASLTSA
jgi:hypothetical protein